MPLDTKLQHQLQQSLQVVDDADIPVTRLLDDARRLWHRVQRLITLDLTPPQLDLEALELACHALQLPTRHRKSRSVGKLGQISLRERAEQAAELVIGALADHADEQLLDRVTRLLRELPLRQPSLNEARLLADAVNLDDFGVTGLTLQAMQLARQQTSVASVAQGIEKRQQYGYFEARLKDGFHFEPIRQMARKRLETALHVATLLLNELKEDQAP